ncbi:MAG: adenylyl-sulfate kinase [Actinomycetota bacterium]
MKQGFAIWITGTPASGKSAVTKELVTRLSAKGYQVQVLESDELRKILTPRPTYSEEERGWFYEIVIYLGKMLTDNGVNVIFDATGNKRRYRDSARSQIEQFAEVYVKCPPEVCVKRDPKGIYRKAVEGKAPTVPGLGSLYEEPLTPEVTTESDKETPAQAADKILNWLKTHWL